MQPAQKIAINTRLNRKWHRQIAIISAVFLVLVAGTGLLLAWKKHSFGYLQAHPVSGSNLAPESWQSMAKIQSAATQYLNTNLPQYDTVIDRIDVRPKAAVAKVIFANHYTALHIDMSNAGVLLVETRRADFIEQLHDGSIIDKLLPDSWGKRLYSSFTGLSLLVLCITGFYLWLNPLKIRKHKRGRHKKQHKTPVIDSNSTE